MHDYDQEEYYSASSEASPVRPSRHSTRKPNAHTPLQVQSFISSAHQSNVKINIKMDKHKSHMTPSQPKSANYKLRKLVLYPPQQPYLHQVTAPQMHYPSVQPQLFVQKAIPQTARSPPRSPLRTSV